MSGSIIARPAGLQDYYGEREYVLLSLREQMLDIFSSYGYSIVEPPILENAEVFLERSGEAIRQRMYMFDDPHGRELCLRPELTIPIAQLFIQSLGCPSGITRMSYNGPAFRYESPGKGRYRQFYQVGVECIGATDKEAADAETVALAFHTACKAGIQPKVKLGDLELFNCFIDSLSVPAQWRTRLKRYFYSQEMFERVLTDMISKQTAPAELDNDFYEALAVLGPEKAQLVIEKILTLSDIEQLGDRNTEEIATRFIDRSTGIAEAISKNIVDNIQNFLSFSGEPSSCLRELQKYCETIGADIKEPLKKFERRLKLISAYDIPEKSMEFSTGFRRGIEYYTGFIFELHVSELGRQASQICGGGRYDRLLENLGAQTAIPANGFAIGLDRILLALEKNGNIKSDIQCDKLHAIICPIGEEGVEAGIKIAQLFRQEGWRISLDQTGQRPGKIIGRASKAQVPYVIFVGEEEISRNCVKLKKLSSHEQIEVSISDLRTFAATTLPEIA